MMMFSPIMLRILALPFLAWENVPCKRRQYVALLAHELTHMIDWIIVYRCDAERWNRSEVQEEYIANLVQDVILRCLLVKL